MKVLVKRIYEPAAKSDGFRVLVETVANLERRLKKGKRHD